MILLIRQYGVSGSWHVLELQLAAWLMSDLLQLLPDKRTLFNATMHFNDVSENLNI